MCRTKKTTDDFLCSGKSSLQKNLSCRQFRLGLLIFLVLQPAPLFPWAEAAVYIDNAVTGSPIIECEREFIKFKVPTKQAFKGKVYVKGEYNSPECVHSYSDETDNFVTKSSTKSTKSSSRSASRENSSRNFPNSAETDRLGLSVERVDGDRSTTSKSRSNNLSNGRSENVETKNNGQSFGRSESVENQSAGSENRKSARRKPAHSQPVGGQRSKTTQEELQGSRENGERSEKYERIHETYATKEARSSEPPLIVINRSKTSNVSPQQQPQATDSHPETFGPPTDAKFEIIPEDDVIKGNGNVQQNPESHPENYETTEFHTTRSQARVALSPGDNSHLPGFGQTAQTANWRNFLRGRQNGLDGQNFRRYGSKVSPDANGECPLMCPPCEQCQNSQYDTDESSVESGRKRRRRSENSAELEILLGTCSTRRDRTANPPGVHVSFTVIVSFHDNFITKVDRAYHVDCAYEEADHTVTTQMDVSQAPEMQLEGQVESPQCHYRIQTPNENGGGYVTNVKVGDTVEHKWICASENSRNSDQEDPAWNLVSNFGLLVHDCYVDDGKGRKELVVDSRGCSKDEFILPTPHYSTKELSASAKSLVAKFPDRDLVGFQCSITICMRELGHCDRVTPPNCGKDAHSNGPPLRVRRDVKESENNSASGTDELWQLNSQVLTVLDAEMQKDPTKDGSDPEEDMFFPHRNQRNTIQALQFQSPYGYDEFCVSITAFGVLIASSTFLVTICTAIIFVVTFMNKTYV
ncbi:cuticlin-1 [Ditylenchus destructor]|uniref:Cuticlin-1 n=1 Tax=Ditylenchus destructor TaxID=166010 RepID=A0AAD4MM66_9BILA|nr:cuticlin-1 [Ditylenchus destructor]